MAQIRPRELVIGEEPGGSQGLETRVDPPRRRVAVVLHDGERDARATAQLASKLADVGFVVKTVRRSTPEVAARVADYAPDVVLAMLCEPLGASAVQEADRMLACTKQPFVWVASDDVFEQQRFGQRASATLALSCPARELSQRIEAVLAVRAREDAWPGGSVVSRALFDAVPMGMLVANPQSGMIQANRVLLDMLGYTAEQFSERGATGITHPEDRDADAELFAALLMGRRDHYDIEKRFVSASGVTRWAKLTVSLIRSDHGDGPVILAIVRDLHDEKETVTALARQTARFDQALAQMPMVFWALSPDYREVAYLSAAFERVYGRPCQQMRDRPSLWMEAMHPEDREQILPRLEALASRASEFEYRIVRPDGSVRWILDRAFPILDNRGQIDLIAGFAEDVTEKREATIQRDEMEDRLRRSQKLQSLGMLAGGIAHDFNNLLMAIMGYTELAKRRIGPEHEAAAFMDGSLESCRRAAELCGQMLAYAGRGTLEMAPLEISHVVREMASMLAVAVSHKARLRFDLASNLPCIRGDAAQLRQLLMNLTLNASEALGDAGGEVLIRTSMATGQEGPFPDSFLDEEARRGPLVMLEVSDNGCGISDHAQPIVFDPFYTTKQKGRGLGLPAVLGILRSHKGALRLTSKEQAGTTFHLVFPPVPASRRPAVALPNRVPWRGSGRVLVADDEPAVREVTRSMLETLGFQVDMAADGAEAVELFRNHPGAFACVLLDLTMPVMDGVQALHRIRGIDSNALVILASGYSEMELERRAVGEKLAGMLQKPYNLEGLALVLQRVLEAGAV